MSFYWTRIMMQLNYSKIIIRKINKFLKKSTVIHPISGSFLLQLTNKVIQVFRWCFFPHTHNIIVGRAYGFTLLLSGKTYLFFIGTNTIFQYSTVTFANVRKVGVYFAHSYTIKLQCISDNND